MPVSADRVGTTPPLEPTLGGGECQGVRKACHIVQPDDPRAIALAAPPSTTDRGADAPYKGRKRCLTTPSTGS
jgi:hypothetical protein